MLDKICSFLLLPFYATWKILLDHNFERKKIQEKIFSVSYLFNSIAYLLFYLNVSNLLLKIIFGLLTVATFSAFCSGYLKILLLKQLEEEYLKDKWSLYKKLILYIITSLSISIYFKYFPIFFISLGQIIFLFILVGFEFPDEPPKKEKELQKNESWLANLLAPKPVTNV